MRPIDLICFFTGFLSFVSAGIGHAQVVDWKSHISMGLYFDIVFSETQDKFDDWNYTGDSNTDPMGTIKGGEIYTCRYWQAQYECRGFNQGRGAIGTWTYSNATPAAYQISLWGRVLKFNDEGEVIDPQYGRVGHLSMARTHLDTIPQQIPSKEKTPRFEENPS